MICNLRHLMSLRHPVRGTLFSRVAASFIRTIPRVMHMTHSWLIRDSFVTHSYERFLASSIWPIRDTSVTHSWLTYMTFIHDLFMWHTGVYTRSSSNHAPRVVHMTRSWLNPMTHSWLVHMTFTHDSFIWHTVLYAHKTLFMTYSWLNPMTHSWLVDMTFTRDSYVTHSCLRP